MLKKYVFLYIIANVDLYLDTSIFNFQYSIQSC